MRVLHVNLSTHFGEAELQTEHLIRALAAATPMVQHLVCHKESVLNQRLRNTERLMIHHTTHRWFNHNLPTVNLVHVHEPHGLGWAWWHKRHTGTDYVVTWRNAARLQDNKKNREYFESASTAIAISRVIQRHLLETGWCGVRRIPDSFIHLPNSAMNVTRLRGEFEGKFIIGHIGEANEKVKGQRVLLEAARELRHEMPDALFLFIGDGPDLEKLKEESTDMENVQWAGEQKNLGDYLSIMNVFAYPARSEPFGTILLNAMDYQVPIVASQVDGIPDLVQNNRTGLLFPKAQPGPLADALRQLYRDTSLRNQLAREAHGQLKHFSLKAMVVNHINLYRQWLMPDAPAETEAAETEVSSPEADKAPSEIASPEVATSEEVELDTPDTPQSNHGST